MSEKPVTYAVAISFPKLPTFARRALVTLTFLGVSLTWMPLSKHCLSRVYASQAFT